MCQSCYTLWWRKNRDVAKRPDLAERFWSKVDRLGVEDCWEWLASKMATGYGRFGPGGRAGGMTTAHRVAYELTFGPIPEGLSIDHLCRNRGCVNPSHLEAVSQRVNVLRGETIPARNAAKTTCDHGHELTPENTYAWQGKRDCRACGRDSDKRRRQHS
jgi:hypothetical protein